jgi:ABC-type branched-subunit amino acid transport system substrate-binding protein
MRSRSAITALMLGATFVATTSKPGNDQKGSPSDPPFLVEIVGAGLDPKKQAQEQDCAPRPYDACAMARGADAAFRSPQMENAKRYVTYEMRDDSDDIGVAVAVARRLQSNPRVLAVIGHSSSDTTKAAAPVYSEAQIPLLVPIATSATVAYPALDGTWRRFLPTDAHSDPDLRLKNVYRLIPNDKVGQAPAIVYVARHLLNAPEQSISIVADASNNAEYAKSLDEELLKLLPQARHDRISEEHRDESLRESMLPDLFASKQPKTTVIIFVGTAKSAKRFLSFLADQRWPEVPDIILTDGAKNLDVPYDDRLKNFHVFLTFPVNQIPSGSLHNDANTDALRSALRDAGEQSYEVYGYDAMLMIGKALTELCKKAPCSISRPDFIEKLHEISAFDGVLAEYLFNEGENVHPDYGLYGSVPFKEILHHGGETRNTSATGDTAAEEEKNCRNMFEQLDRSALPWTMKKPTGTDLELQYYCAIGFDTVHKHSRSE